MVWWRWRRWNIDRDTFGSNGGEWKIGSCLCLEDLSPVAGNLVQYVFYISYICVSESDVHAVAAVDGFDRIMFRKVHELYGTVVQQGLITTR